MRENKFRGISERTGQFSYGGLVRANSEQGNCWAIKDTIYNINNGIINIIPEIVKPETVGQYTELKDKTETEIYAGDIIRFDATEWGDNTTNIHVVRWNEKEGSWCWGGGSSADMCFRTVIGNIHQDKDLLK